MSPIRVLCIHFTGAFGGASRSLFEALSEISPEDVRPMFLTQHGSVVDFFSKLGPVVATRGLSQFDNTRYSHYRGMRWVVLLRELAYLPFTILALRTAKRQFGDIDLIHVNEFTGLMTLWLAQLYFKAPALVHVRSLARTEVRSLRSRLEIYLFRKLAAGVVAIDQNVRSSLPAGLPVKIIHNSFRVKAQIDTEENSRALAELSPTSFKVGFVGNLLKVKGIFELLQAALSLRDEGIDVEFVIVGDDAKPSTGLKSRVIKALGLQQNSKADIERFLDDHQLRSIVHLLGFTSNIGQIYRAMDVLCFPSHFDAPGRPIFEAAFYGVPSIVAVKNPCDDTLIHGETGLAIASKSTDEISAAVKYLIAHPEKRKAMGAAALTLAKNNFDVSQNSRDLLFFYNKLIFRK
jgi:glycosyltransferase involved in cell wall biosynthesis